jgi:hypothetical protein
MANGYCLILTSVLIASPYNLAWGSEIYAQVSATNIKGTSIISDTGNGAIILTYPDAPTDLANNDAGTSGKIIALTWNQGADGGSAIIAYRISYN